MNAAAQVTKNQMVLDEAGGTSTLSFVVTGMLCRELTC